MAMTRPGLVSACVCLMLLFNGCLARSAVQFSRQDECQLNRLEAREPDTKVECEGGLMESWDPNHDQFQCAGVALLRLTIQPKALHLPSYTNGPQLVHVVRGQGVIGIMFPGCPETFEEAQQGVTGGSHSRAEDRHQQIRHIREGDVVAIAAGASYWSYNNGDSPLVTVNLLDVGNHNNQLDRSPRRFYLAGNPHDEFRQSRREEQRLSEMILRGRGGSQEEQHRTSPNNVFHGFSLRFIQEAFRVDAETARKIQNPEDRRGSIIRVKGELEFVQPGRSREEQEHIMRQQDLKHSEREYGTGTSQPQQRNGLEETICSMRVRENIGDTSRADLFVPQAGRLSSVNSFNLPILSFLRLSAERGFLYSNAMYAPHWNMNAHSVMYVIRGSARCQVVDNFGRSVFDGELRQGQALTVPQNYAIVKKAQRDGFEWISFKTNHNAKINQLAGRVSFMQALPEDVIANSYQISREQARRLKFNRQETTLFATTASSKWEIAA